MIGSFPIGSVPYGSNPVSALPQSVTTIAAQANAQAYGFDIGVEIGQASASGLAYNSTPRFYVEALSTQATTESFDAGVFRALELGFSQANAQAYSITPVGVVADDVVAIAQAYDIQPKFYLEFGLPQASAQAYSITPVGLETDDVVGIAQAYDFSINRTLDFGIALSSAQAYGIIPKLIVATQIAQASAQAYRIEKQDLETDDVVATAQAYDMTPIYIIPDIPDIVATRSSDLESVEIKVLNSSIGNVNIYRADDHKALFSKIATDQASPYTNSGLDVGLNYKYRAAFVVLGNIGGSPVEQEGQKSEPRYTIGNRTL